MLKVHFKANHIDIRFTTFIPDLYSVLEASSPDLLVIADELKGSIIDLEWHDLVAVELGRE